MKHKEMGGECRKYEGEDGCNKVLVGKPEVKGSH
jgi:hypothetical protein